MWLLFPKSQTFHHPNEEQRNPSIASWGRDVLQVRQSPGKKIHFIYFHHWPAALTKPNCFTLISVSLTILNLGYSNASAHREVDSASM